uniref:cyclin-dependent kinase n=1 Tax=Callorhinchus milii TaxID=7868 RepID=A0A4W3HQF4_CALMI
MSLSSMACNNLTFLFFQLNEVSESPRNSFACDSLPPRLYHTLQVRKLRGHRNRSNSDPLGGKNYTQSYQWRNGLRFGTAASYLNLEKLGEGSYSTVYKGISRINGHLVALKVIKIKEEEGVPFTAIREASLLKGIKHSNIVLLHDIIHTPETLTFVFEYVQTDLAQYMTQHPGGLHAHNVKVGSTWECYIKSMGNLPFFHLRLFPGLARAKSVPSQTYSTEVVTLWYRPPDVLLGATDYSTGLDVWGAGCIFIEMVEGSPAFPGVSDANEQLQRIWAIQGTPTEETWPGVSSLPNHKPEHFRPHPPRKLGHIWKRLGLVTKAEDLTSKLIECCPRRRIPAEAALQHEYFSSLPPQLAQLPDMVSIFTVAGIRLEPEARNAFHPFRKERCSSILA